MTRRSGGGPEFDVPRVNPLTGQPQTTSYPRPVDPTSPEADSVAAAARTVEQPKGSRDRLQRTALGVPVDALLLAVVTVLVVVALLLLLLSTIHLPHGKPSARAGDDAAQVVATRYLNALSDADADAALTVAVAPASRTFLTDQVLVQQQQIARISAITVSSSEAAGSTATVTVSFRFGDRPVRDRLFLTKHDGAWKVDPGVVKYDIPELQRMAQPTLFGRPVTGDDPLYVFPGPVEFSSANGGFAVDARDRDGWPMVPTTTTQRVRLTSLLSDAGRSTVLKAVSGVLVACRASRSLEPAGCPQHEFDAEGVDGSADWTLTSDVESLEMTVDPAAESMVRVRGTTKWTVRYDRSDYTGAVRSVSDDVAGTVDGTVDLSQAAPTFRSG